MSETPTTWSDFAVNLFDKLTGRDAVISYTFDKLEMNIPMSTEDKTPKAPWVLNGTLHITTSESAK
jgi:hypothetical protein